MRWLLALTMTVTLLNSCAPGPIAPVIRCVPGSITIPCS